MNNIDIDKLIGDELNTAVLIALGAELICGSHSVFWTLNDKRIPDKRYAWKIADAWTLDGDGWRWFQDETTDGKMIVYCEIPFGKSVMLKRSVVSITDFPTKAAAYAVARCRVWLKAQQAEVAQ
jgi:hypothetical protein